jgi:hypothetical protein
MCKREALKLAIQQLHGSNQAPIIIGNHMH